MKLTTRAVLYFLLLFNGTGAIYGGLNLMLHPDGSSLGLGLNWLKHSPFSNYLVPGIVLFISNGLFSLFVFYRLWSNTGVYALLVMLQGIILEGWIIIEMLLMRTVHFLHLILATAGVLLLIGGYILNRRTNTNENGIN